MIQVKLNGTEVVVNNLGELEINFSFDPFTSQNAQLISANALELPCTPDGSKDGKAFVDTWIATQGVFKGIPVEIIDTETGENVFPDGFLDLANPNNEFDTDIYTIALVSRIQRFAESADFNLSILWKNGDLPTSAQLTEADCKQIRYILRGVPDYLESAITVLTIFIFTEKVIQQSKELIKSITRTLRDITPEPVVTTGGPGNTVPTDSAITPWDIAADAIYLIALIAAIIALLKDLSDTLFQKPVALLSTPVKAIFEKACTYLGVEFDSTIFTGRYADMCILPKTSNKGKITGTPENFPVPDYTFIELMDRVGAMFNAKGKLLPTSGGGYKLKFENIAKFRDSPINYQIPDLDNKGVFSYNLSELPRTYKIAYQQDQADLHSYTIDNYRYGVEYTIAGDTDKITTGLTNDVSIELPFALAARNSATTFAERLFNSLYDLVKRIEGVRPNKGKLGDRTGFMLLSNELIGVDKLLLVNDDEKLYNASELSASYLFENYHAIEGPDQNQWITYSNPGAWSGCPLSLIGQIKQQNAITNNGTLTVLTAVQYQLDDKLLNVASYRVKNEYISPEIITRKQIQWPTD